MFKFCWQAALYYFGLGVSMRVFLEEVYRVAVERNRRLERLLGGVECRGRGGFRRALEGGFREHGVGFIGEFKRCRPGRFVYYRDPRDFVEKIGCSVDAVSVLVEPYWFCGSLELVSFFAEYKPVLFKDFVVGRGQIMAAACWGASSILLILDMLGWRLLERLYEEARSYGLEPFIETSSANDAVAVAESFPDAIVGINARDLRTLKLDFEKLVEEVGRAAEKLPSGTLLVAESGVKSGWDVVRVVKAGAKAVLVGTAVMERPDIVEEAYRLLSMGRRESF